VRAFLEKIRKLSFRGIESFFKAGVRGQFLTTEFAPRGELYLRGEIDPRGELAPGVIFVS
jgi:hypothetical protein